MAPLVVPGIARFSLVGTISDRAWAQVFDMHIESGGIGTRDENVFNQAQVFLNEWIDHIAPVTTAAAILTGCRWVDLDTLEATSGERQDAEAPRTMPKPGNGGATGAAPSNVAVLARKIASSGRSKRNGRSYFPGVAEASVDGNNLTTAFRSSFNTALQDFLDGISQSGATSFGGYDSHLVVVHEPASGEVSHSNVTTLVADTKVATQRRRLRG